MLHEFENGWCKICGENFDYMVDERLREFALIGPMLPVDDNQGTFALTLNVLV